MEYHAPGRLDEALEILAKGGDVRLLAGGTDIYPAAGPAGPRASMLDITGISDLQGITRDAADGGWRIGAATRWCDVVRAADLPPAFDGLRDAARQVGGVQIQNAGTIAGNICNASPAADGVPPLLTLDAEVEIAGPDGPRRSPLSDFITGPRQVDMRPGEIVTALCLPDPPVGARGGFAKLGSRAYLVISIAMVAALVRFDGAGRIAQLRLAVGACSPVARRLPELEAALVGQHPADIAVGAADLAPLAPIDDVRGSAAYRREAAARLIERLLREVGGDG